MYLQQNAKACNLALKLQKTASKTFAANSSSLGTTFASKLPLGVSQAGPRAFPGSAQGAQRRLQAASVTPVWLPRAPLVSLWLPLCTASVPPKAILGAWGPQMSGFKMFWDPESDARLRIYSSCLISTILSCLGFIFPCVFAFMDSLVIKLLNC